MTKCQKDPTCGIFLKRGLFKDLKNYIPKCQTHKYKIHKYTNTNFTVSGYIYIWHIWHTLLLVNCSIDKFHNLTVQAMSIRLNRFNRLLHSHHRFIILTAGLRFICIVETILWNYSGTFWYLLKHWP